jgi:hypothetical protein
MTGCRDNDGLFVEGVHLLEGDIGDRFGDEGGVELARQNVLRQRFRIADPKLQRDIGIELVKLIQRFGQPHRRGAFHRAEPKHAAWPGIMNR